MASNARTASYSVEEDMIICHVYLDITQNPIICINQSKDQFWTRVEEAYSITKPNSLQFNRAKDLFMQDSNYSKRFKFDHVWPIMKDIEKFSSDINPSSSVPKIHVTNLDSSQSEAQTPETPISGSPGLHSFSINLSSDENAGGTSSGRPIGVKKAKLKKKKNDNISELLSTMKQGHHNLINILEKGSTELQQHYDFQMLKLQNDKLKLKNQQKKIETRQQEMALAALQEENRVLYMDLSTIGDPEMREIIRIERAKIMRKRE
ncbi:uncharacterized protein [Primulina huaijiensis]|uniref:uncharacterized protein n=1 Tax=Primulina huaijiensis TaxID=1492673 RepID=UPI003CC75E64